MKLSLQLFCEFLESCHILGYDFKSTSGTVVVGGPLIPYFEALVATHKSVRSVVLAVMCVLDFVHLDSLKD
jgi:hypothetical protein